MEDETLRSRTITLPGGPGEHGRIQRLRGFTDSFAGGIVYAMAVMVGSVVVGFVILTMLTLLVVQIAERAVGVTIT